MNHKLSLCWHGDGLRLYFSSIYDGLPVVIIMRKGTSSIFISNMADELMSFYRFYLENFLKCLSP